MLSRNFRLQKVGDLKWLQKNYNFSQIAFSIDELIILDVTRGERNEALFCEHVKALTEECFVPIAAGGGIRTLEQARRLLHSGADKIVINSLVSSKPEVLEEIATEFGSQCIVASVDVKQSNNGLKVFTENGSCQLVQPATEWLRHIAGLAVGEIYLNSMDRDGTGQGYLFELLDIVPNPISIPVILAGGAGKYHHLAEGLRDERVDAVATAHLFNFVGNGLELARIRLLEEGFSLAKWDIELAKGMRGIHSV